MKYGIENKKVILAVCGGIAAYKSAEILRLLKKQGADVRVMMTQNAQWFVGALTFEALSGQPVFKDIFAESSEASFRHIEWAQETEGVIIAPATANMTLEHRYAGGNCAGPNLPIDEYANVRKQSGSTKS
jgi:phosphopantothenoylcysteine decarboxylase/phosphopantothenate--cysteine ligase